MAKRTVIKQKPDGSTEITTQGCFGKAFGLLIGFSLLLYALVSPAQELPWWGALLAYLGMAALTALIVWGLVWQHRTDKAKAAAASATPKPPHVITPVRPPAISMGTPTPALSAEMTRLAALHRNGDLSDAEFQAAKKRLLGQ